MDSDFIRALGYKALDSRLKRISDRMSHDVRRFYKEMGMDVEPNWYLVFMLLEREGEIPITAIADALGYTHPSVAVIVKKMAGKGYLQVRKDSADQRKQLVSLSKKSLKALPRLQEVWHSCERAIRKMLNKDLSILHYLDQVDAKLESISFHDRFKQEFLKSPRS